MGLIEVVLVVKPPHSWVKSVLDRYPQAVLRIIDCKALPEGEGVQELFEIDIDDTLVEDVMDGLRKDGYVYDVDVLRTRERTVYGSVKTHRCLACRTFADSNCFLSSVRSKEDGRLEWVLLGSNDSFRSLVKKLQKDGIEVEVGRISELKDERALTARQERILQIAYEKGYFDNPKGVNLRELSRVLKISPPTLSELLRKGQKNVLKQHFRGRLSTVARQNRL